MGFSRAPLKRESGAPPCRRGRGEYLVIVALALAQGRPSVGAWRERESGKFRGGGDGGGGGDGAVGRVLFATRRGGRPLVPFRAETHPAPHPGPPPSLVEGPRTDPRLADGALSVPRHAQDQRSLHPSPRTAQNSLTLLTGPISTAPFDPDAPPSRDDDPFLRLYRQGDSFPRSGTEDPRSRETALKPHTVPNHCAPMGPRPARPPSTGVTPISERVPTTPLFCVRKLGLIGATVPRRR